MSVMTPDMWRQQGGRQGQSQLQRQAVVEQLGQEAPVTPLPGAANTLPAGNAPEPRATVPSAFQRGGEVRQLPGSGAQLTNQMVGTGAKIATTAAGAVNPISIGTDYLGGKLKPKEEMPTFGGEFGHITDDYGRRFEGAGPGVAGGAVRGAGYGAFAGPIGAGVGAAAGALVGALTKNATSAFSDFRVEDGADAIQKAYRQYLGRDASEQEIQDQLVGQGWDPNDGDRWVGEKGLFSVLGSIRDSEEAKRYATRDAVVDQLGAEAGGEPSASMATPGAQRIEGSASGAAPGAAGDWSRLEGFDHDKLNSGHDSPKYQVGRILAKYPPTPEGLRQALPELQALGIGDVAIGGSKGDKLTFSGNTDPRFNGVTTFDVIRAAGNGGEGWQWQGEGGAAPQAAQAAPGAALSLPEGRERAATNGGILGDPETLARIRAELERIMAGQPNRDALMQGLGA